MSKAKSLTLDKPPYREIKIVAKINPQIFHRIWGFRFNLISVLN
ncbi:hypothetical protein B6N60_02982 [Richelia sinica FACHB-800]|uniref:Uncharacterized protein n=1 Tax=Richelia sinica FACHB-800 TaxID=1357546 RepID=A0A975TA63_9NOST|nr:hypothetical protein B6N60_02982 [Richelia sinica FACHB-800]